MSCDGEESGGLAGIHCSWRGRPLRRPGLRCLNETRFGRGELFPLLDGVIPKMRHRLAERGVLAVAAAFLAGTLIRVWFVAAGPRAFVGDLDTIGYVAAWGNRAPQVRPYGYSFFLHAAHRVSANISFTIVLQHVLGLVAAGLLYASVRRFTHSRAAAVIAAAFILFDGFEIFLEHALLSESFFVLLVVAFTYALLRAFEGSWTWIVLSGVFIAAAGVVRSVGLTLIPLSLVALLIWRPDTQIAGWRGRIGPAAAFAVGAIAVFGAYLAALSGEPGSPKLSLSPASGRVLYSRVAPFADCGKFTPPAGAARLCERTPASRRLGTNYYLWTPTNPAWRVYGPPPRGDGKLFDFAISAIVAQPGAYVSAVLKDLGEVVTVEHEGAFVDGASQRLPVIAKQTQIYYHYSAGDHRLADRVLPFARTIFANNVVTTIVLALSVIGVGLTRGPERRGTLVFAITGWTLILAAVATANYDPRYSAVAVPFLAAASTPAVLWVARRAWPVPASVSPARSP
jgi:dolichyl-phosphate-mannose-protein mannosyltransferase